MHTAVIVVHLIVSLVMIFFVLLQSGKGASIGSSFGGAGSQTLFGSAGPASALGKITAVCAAIFMMTSLYLTFVSSHSEESSIMRDVPEVSAPATPAAPAAPVKPLSPDEPISKLAPEVESSKAPAMKKKAAAPAVKKKKKKTAKPGPAEASK